MSPRPAQVSRSERRDEGGHWLTVRFDGDEFVVAAPEAYEPGAIVHVTQDESGRLALAALQDGA